MKPYAIDRYVIDVLLPDLVGHDRRPAAFLVYLALLCEADRRHAASVPISLQELATRTGLGKSTVQAAIRHLKQRGLIDPEHVATTSAPSRKVVRVWEQRD
jgi:DNA-binding MarR family transcriptional regulator